MLGWCFRELRIDRVDIVLQIGSLSAGSPRLPDCAGVSEHGLLFLVGGLGGGIERQSKFTPVAINVATVGFPRFVASISGRISL